MKGRTPTLSESLGEYAVWGFTIQKPNRRNSKRIKRTRIHEASYQSTLKNAA